MDLKVCMVVDSFFEPGGIATAARELSYNLALRGIKVDVVTRGLQNSDSEKLLKITNVVSRKRPLSLWDISETSFNASKAINRMLSGYDIIHAHGPLALTRFFAKKYTDIPWIVTVHGTFQKERPWFRSYPKTNPDLLRYWIGNRLFVAFEPRLYGSLPPQVRFIAVAEQTKDDLIKMGIRDNKVFVVPNGVNLDLFQPMPIDECRKKLQIKNLIGSDQKMVLTINYMEPRKGIHILLKAFPRILRKIPDAQCIIVGATLLNGYREYLLRLASDLGINQNVHFIGFVADEILPCYFASCNVFVLPSLAEGAPLVIPMAMACRKPVVATTACAAAEYLEPKCTTTPGDYEELGEKLTYYLDNQEESNSLANRLFTKATEHLTWDKIADKTVDVYRNVLQES